MNTLTNKLKLISIQWEKNKHHFKIMKIKLNRKFSRNGSFHNCPNLALLIKSPAPSLLACKVIYYVFEVQLSRQLALN